jgi:hypothetical protein
MKTIYNENQTWYIQEKDGYFYYRLPYSNNIERAEIWEDRKWLLEQLVKTVCHEDLLLKNITAEEFIWIKL